MLSVIMLSVIMLNVVASLAKLAKTLLKRFTQVDFSLVI
jgi:hypothetical protein